MAAVQSFGLGSAVAVGTARLVDVAVVEVAVATMERSASDPGNSDGNDPHMMEDEARIRAVGEDGVVLTGVLLRELRERNPRMPVRVLASRLHYSRSQIYAWESGTYAVPLEMYLPILDAILWWRQQQAEQQEVVRVTYMRLY